MEKHPLQQIIDDLHARHAQRTDGEIATYIPELSKADPDGFGICVATADGRVFEAGDSRREFTIQSISKAICYGLALEDIGVDAMLRKVDVEPSGEAFNSISLHPVTGRPRNPMINAGAIAMSALLNERYGSEAIDHILQRLGAAAGRSLTVDQAVYESESRTGHRNRAIGHLLLNFGIVGDHVEAALDLYLKQYAILVTSRDAAVMAATLANLGTNPVDGQEVFDIGCVKDMLSIMLTCGMYDYSGEWAYRVGIPAKSGVSGGVMAVINRQMGVASVSPRLDRRGNSCRGIDVCADLANELGLHMFDCMNEGSSYLKAILRT